MNRSIKRLVLIALALGCGCREQAGPKPDEHDERHEAEHEDGVPSVVKISPIAVRRAEIRVGKVVRQPLAGALVLPAEVRLDPDRTAHITPIVRSQVASVRVKLGDRVRKGQLLAELRSVELGEAGADIAKSRAAVKVAEDRVARQGELMDAGVGARRALVESEGNLNQARAALKAARSRARIYGAGGGRVTSPMDGTVIARHATPGEVAISDKPLFVVADVDVVWVVGRVYERDVRSAREGAPAVVRLGAYPERSWKARVDYVSPVLDEATRSAEVRVTLENTDGLLKPGLFGTIALDAGGDGGALSVVVPEAALQDVKGKSVIFVPGKQPGEYRAVAVLVGQRAHGLVEILQGVSAGQDVVVSGGFTLKSALLDSELEEGHEH